MAETTCLLCTATNGGLQQPVKHPGSRSMRTPAPAISFLGLLCAIKRQERQFSLPRCPIREEHAGRDLVQDTTSGCRPPAMLQ